MKKRSIALILCVLLVCSLFSGCMQGTAPSETTTAPVQSALPTAVPSSEPSAESQSTGTPSSVHDPTPTGGMQDDEKTVPTCTISIECSTILNNMGDLKKEKLELVPANGVILAPVTVEFSEGESVFDVLQRVCRQNSIQLEATWTPGYNTAYVEGIYNLYEFDCGELSGWTYRVNGQSLNYGCSSCIVCDGDVISWHFTCALGADI